MKKVYLMVLLLAALPALAQQKLDVEATTTGGQKVLLHPDGRWDFADGPQPAAEAKPLQPPAATQSASQGCPPGSQGGWFGTRCIPPGDKDYNRGTMNPSKR